ncbi:hypothetical protein Y032_0134g1826 [Ancylostoma ceylanicum]|uniref:Uncharacterized protein n=1 Tax=Ancylostoma ceylanicum TaxID=53326 RepID=A0A016T5T9_9BILA|nr:hypothetical protein Y032_0134g1826 [Ancylostoma ceylanicum]
MTVYQRYQTAFIVVFDGTISRCFVRRPSSCERRTESIQRLAVAAEATPSLSCGVCCVLCCVCERRVRPPVWPPASSPLSAGL